MMNTRHLSDEQFEELLAGGTPVEAVAHLDACADCRSELDLMRASLADLRDLSFIWAEQRSVRIQPPSRTALLWRSIPVWSVAALVLLLCGIGVGLHAHSTGDTTAQVSRSEPVPPSEHELARDNQLLESIDNELHRQTSSQLPFSGLVRSSRAGRRSVSREVVN